MALTNAQKVSVRFYLGYQGRFYQVDSKLEQAMSAIDDADLETRINAVIVELDAIDARRSAVRVNGGIAQVDEVQFQPGNASLNAIIAEGSMLVGRLAALFGVEVRHNPFSTSAATGSAYMKQG